MATILKGKAVADHMKEQLLKQCEELKSQHIEPCLGILRIGAREDDLAYERGAKKKMESLGIQVRVKEYPEDISQEEFIEAVKEANQEDAIHGILIFRPFPKHISEDAIKHVIDPRKDIDCFSPVNVAKLMEGDASGFAPCTPTAVVEMLKYYEIPLQGKNVVVLGRSMVVGKPAAMLLLAENATVTICHSKTVDLPSITSKADILVAAIGKPRFVKKDFVGQGAVVMDVGINVDQEQKLCGDVDFDQVQEVAQALTPVPAGVGSVTTSVLAKHVLRAAKVQHTL